MTTRSWTPSIIRKFENPGQGLNASYYNSNADLATNVAHSQNSNATPTGPPLKGFDKIKRSPFSRSEPHFGDAGENWRDERLTPYGKFWYDAFKGSARFMSLRAVAPISTRVVPRDIREEYLRKKLRKAAGPRGFGDQIDGSRVKMKPEEDQKEVNDPYRGPEASRSVQPGDVPNIHVSTPSDASLTPPGPSSRSSIADSESFAGGHGSQRDARRNPKVTKDAESKPTQPRAQARSASQAPSSNRSANDAARPASETSTCSSSTNPFNGMYEFDKAAGEPDLKSSGNRHKPDFQKAPSQKSQEPSVRESNLENEEKEEEEDESVPELPRSASRAPSNRADDANLDPDDAPSHRSGTSSRTRSSNRPQEIPTSRTCPYSS